MKKESLNKTLEVIEYLLKNNGKVDRNQACMDTKSEYSKVNQCITLLRKKGVNINLISSKTNKSKIDELIKKYQKNNYE